jgi:hypothetical protein
MQVFSSRSAGGLWTVAQSQPGTSATPTGTWDVKNKFNLGKKLIGPATVVANTDGRLTVFGVNAGHQVTYKSQTQTVQPGTNPTGIWAGGWAKLNQQKARSVTVQNTAGGGFEVFAVGKNSATLYERTELAAGTSSTPDGYWADWSDLAPIGSDRCGGPGSLTCLNITNVGLNLALDLTDPTDPSSYVSRAAPDPSASTQQWSLQAAASGGTFSLVNNSNNECASDKDEPIIGTWHVHMATCSTADTSQQYFLEPVTPSTTAKPAAYRIRQVITGTCLTALKGTNGDHPGNLVERIDCNNTDPNNNNTWQLGRRGAIAPGVLDLALDYAAAQCTANNTTNTCTFVDVTTPSAYQAAGGCVVGSVLYNASSANATYTASWSHMTGSQWSVGGTVEFGYNSPGASGGPSFKTSFTASHAWLDQSSFQESVSVPVPPREFGWVEYAPVERETIGYWNITLGGRTWTVPGHNISIAKDGTNGATALKITRTSNVPPTDSHCNM